MAEDMFVGTDRGVTVVQTKKAFEVAFSYDRELVDRMHKVLGAEFSKDEKWVVPLASKDALTAAVAGMRVEHEAIAKDKTNIFDLATSTAVARQSANGSVDEKAKPQVSDYRELGKASYGEIVNVNARFAAQLTGFGKDTGSAFVSVHRLNDLDSTVFKGDQVKIAYDDKGRGTVTARAPEQKLGEVIDGVKVEAKGDLLHVSFGINQAMAERLRRVADVTFDKEQGVFVVPAAHKEFVSRAVHDMRKEFVADSKERDDMKGLAGAKVDNAVVRDAFTKDGQKQWGPVIGISERYVMQSGGMGQFKLHRKDALEGAEPVIGHNIEVAYAKGRGTVTDKTLGKEQGKEASMSR